MTRMMPMTKLNWLTLLLAAEERIAELEKNKEELGDKIEDLTDTLRAVATQIENLNAAADTFVSEVESL